MEKLDNIMIYRWRVVENESLIYILEEIFRILNENFLKGKRKIELGGMNRRKKEKSKHEIQRCRQKTEKGMRQSLFHMSVRWRLTKARS